MYVVSFLVSMSMSDEEAKEENLRADLGSAAWPEDAARGVCSRGEDENKRLGRLLSWAPIAAGVEVVICA